jgi:hypothetical protein
MIGKLLLQWGMSVGCRDLLLLQGLYVGDLGAHSRALWLLVVWWIGLEVRSSWNLLLDAIPLVRGWRLVLLPLGLVLHVLC